jgi:hypothetical protein
MRSSSDWLETLPKDRLMVETVVIRSLGFEGRGLHE